MDRFFGDGKNISLDTLISSIRRHPLLFLYGTVCLLSLFHTLELTLVLTSIPLVYTALSRILGIRFFPSRLFLGVISFVVFIALLQISFFFGWIFYKEITLTPCVILTLFLTLILFLVSKRLPKLPKRPFATRYDLVAIAAVVLFSVPFFGMPLHRVKGDIKSSFLVFIDAAYDDSSHLGMFNDRIQFDRAILAGTAEAKESRYSGVIYPAGWHAANAVLAKSIKPNIQPGVESAIFYVLSKSLWLIVLVYMLARVSGLLIEVRKEKQLGFIVYCTLTALSISFTSIFFADIYITGFYSFLPVIITTCLIIPSIFELYDSKNQNQLLLASVLPMAVISLSTLSWLLVLPMFGIGIGLIILEQKRLLLQKRGWSVYPVVIFLLVAFLFIVSTLLQIKVSSSGEGAVSFVDGILIPGGIPVYPVGFYVLCFALFGFYILITKKSHLVPVALYLTGLTLFIGVIYFIQQYKVQLNTYYFYKSLAVLTTSLIIFGSAGLSYIMNSLPIRSTVVAGSVGFALPLMFIMYLNPNSVIFTYIEGNRAASPEVTTQIYKELATDYQIANYTKKDVTIFYPSNNQVLNEVGSMILKVNRIHNDCYWKLKNASFTTKVANFDPSIINSKECEGYHVEYYLNKDDVADFVYKLQVNNLLQRVTVQVLTN